MNALDSFIDYLFAGNSVTPKQAKTLFKVSNVADLAYRARNEGFAVYTNRYTTSRGEKTVVYRLGTPSKQFLKYLDRSQFARARKTLYRNAISVKMAA